VVDLRHLNKQEAYCLSCEWKRRKFSTDARI